jgi:diacylglycerol kinase family enzyme
VTRTAVIFNPEKISEAKLRKLYRKVSDQELFLMPTDSKSGGFEAGKRAIDLEMERVVVAGGDGTLRAVVEAIAHSDIVLGILPIGTGNILARNLKLPVHNLESCAHRSLSKSEHRIDLGIARVFDVNGNSHEYLFTGIAGLGMDARLMAATDKKRKRQIGWIAYLEASLKFLPLKFERFEVVVDDQAPRVLKSYSLLVGNAGWLPGAISMMPDARLDDSRLDMAAIGPRRIWNWVDFIGRVTWQNFVVRPLALGRKWLDATANVKTLEHFNGQRISITPSSPAPFQVDGDPMFEVTHAEFTLRPKGLRVSI